MKKRNLHRTYSNELTIDELKQKRKDYYKFAWLYGGVGMVFFIIATIFYLTYFYVGFTLLICMVSLISILGSFHWKICESNLTTLILIKQEGELFI